VSARSRCQENFNPKSSTLSRKKCTLTKFGPRKAIFLCKDYAITGFTRADMVHHKEKLLEIGGVMHGVVLKWNEKK
jgi:hypothetical protein